MDNEIITIFSFLVLVSCLTILLFLSFSAIKFAYVRKDKRLAAYRLYLRSLNIDGLIKEIYRDE